MIQSYHGAAVGIREEDFQVCEAHGLERGRIASQLQRWVARSHSLLTNFAPEVLGALSLIVQGY